MWSRILPLLALASTTLWPGTAASPQWAGGVPPWTNIPTCTPGPDASATAASSASAETAHLYDLSRKFFNNMMVPNNLPQLKDLASPLFAENITGRVSDSRKFLGRELNTEYVFGAFTGPSIDPTRVTLLGMPVSHQPMRFAANAADRSAFVTELVNFNITLLGAVIPVQLDLWMRWNAQDEMTAYDARFVYFDWLMENAMTTMQQKFALASVADAQDHVKTALVAQICTTAQNHCQGNLTQYDSMADCQQFLGTQVRLGQPFEFGRNTVMCRSLHEGMLTLKPEAHCPHVGPTGGDMCTDNLNYGDYVADPDFFGVIGVGS